jgi:hypothetical protein
MAKSFDELVRRTTTKKTREKAARRAQELLAELLLSEVRELTGKSQRQVADALGMKCAEKGISPNIGRVQS